MALWKQNVVKVDLASYMHYIRGVKKVGKTTLFRDLIHTLYDGNMYRGLLISLGDEDGYKALDGLVVATAENWAEFIEIVDELVYNKDENEFKFIALDTVDELFNIAIDEVLRLHKKEYGQPAKSLNAAFGGYGAGRDKVKELVRNEIARLKKAGYGLFVIGHTKIRTIKEKGMDEEYQQLTTSLNFDFDSVIADKADIVATISIDKDITDVKEVDSRKIGSLAGVTRWIHFRDDSFNVDCGARFEHIVPKVELSAENYIKAIEDAIRASAKGKSDKEIEEMKKKEVQEREKKAKEYIERELEIDVKRNEELIEEIKTKFLNVSEERKSKVKEIMDQYGFNNFKDVDGIKTEALEKIVEVLN